MHDLNISTLMVVFHLNMIVDVRQRSVGILKSVNHGLKS